MLEHDAAHDDSDDLVGELFRHSLARPALHALAKQQLRRVDLVKALVTATDSAVHYRTLHRAIAFLRAVGLVTRYNPRPRVVVYELTPFGRELVDALDALDAIARAHQQRADRE